MEYSVSKMTGCGLCKQTWIPSRGKDFSFCHHIQSSSGTHLASHPMGSRGYILETIVAKLWSWPLYSAEVRCLHYPDVFISRCLVTGAIWPYHLDTEKIFSICSENQQAGMTLTHLIFILSVAILNLSQSTCYFDWWFSSIFSVSLAWTESWNMPQLLLSHHFQFTVQNLHLPSKINGFWCWYIDTVLLNSPVHQSKPRSIHKTRNVSIIQWVASDQFSFFFLKQQFSLNFFAIKLQDKWEVWVHH
jgi:hypothetical protein